MKAIVVPFLSGGLFALGLGISGMTVPSKVLAFLDVAGRWDPSLMLVMVGAIAVSAIAFAVAGRRAQRGASPLFGTDFHLPKKGTITASLVAGSVLFGIGWGLEGLCPGPALMLLATGSLGPLLFVLAMGFGMALVDFFRGASIKGQGVESSSPASRA